MTDYTSIADSQVEPLSPVTSELMTALRDNPLAIAEGSTGAPRMVLKSIERLVAGDAIRNQLTQTINSEESFGIGHSFLQIGTIRVKAIQVSGGVASYSITRNRNRVLTVLSSGGLSGTVSVDVGVLPGDAVSATVSVSSFQPGGTYTLSLSTDGGNLWPGSTAQLEGNDV